MNYDKGFNYKLFCLPVGLLSASYFSSILLDNNLTLFIPLAMSNNLFIHPDALLSPMILVQYTNKDIAIQSSSLTSLF